MNWKAYGIQSFKNLLKAAALTLPPVLHYHGAKVDRSSISHALWIFLSAVGVQELAYWGPYIAAWMNSPTPGAPPPPPSGNSSSIPAGRAVALVLLALLVCSSPARAQQDIPVVSGTSPYVVIGRGINWGGSGPGNLGNNFIFSVTDPNEGFCLFILNNNPTSNHSFTVTVAQTGDPSLTHYQGNTGQWFTVPTSTTFPVTVLNSGIVGINYKTTASASVAVVFSGNSTQSGSPDTASVFAVQTNQSACGSIPTNSVQGPQNQGTTMTSTNQFPVIIGGVTQPGTTSTVYPFVVGSSGAGGMLMDASTCCQALANSPQNQTNYKEVRAYGAGAEAPAIYDVATMSNLGTKGVMGGYVKTKKMEAFSDMEQIGASSIFGWAALGKLTNPTAGQILLVHFLSNTSTVNAAYDLLVLNCSAACEITVSSVSTGGSGCTAITPQNLQVGNGQSVQAPNAQDTTANACTTVPTVVHTFYDIPAGANQYTVVDLSGFLNFHNATTGGGIDVAVVSAFTGVATATLYWVEE
jgi:hypothetical protein